MANLVESEDVAVQTVTKLLEQNEFVCTDRQVSQSTRCHDLSFSHHLYPEQVRHIRVSCMDNEAVVYGILPSGVVFFPFPEGSIEQQIKDGDDVQALTNQLKEAFQVDFICELKRSIAQDFDNPVRNQSLKVLGMNWPLNRRRLQYEPENSSLTICKKDNLAEFTFVVLEDNYDEKPTSELNTSSHSYLKNHYESLLVKVVLLLFAEQGEFTCSELAHIKPPYVYMSTRPGCYEFSLAHPHYPDQVVLIRISIMTFGVAFHCHAPKYIYFCFRNVPTLKQITDDSSEIRLMAMLLEKQFIERFIDPIKQAMDKEKTNPSASKAFESLTKGWSYNRRRLWTGNKSDLMNNSADRQNCDDD